MWLYLIEFYYQVLLSSIVLGFGQGFDLLSGWLVDMHIAQVFVLPSTVNVPYPFKFLIFDKQNNTKYAKRSWRPSVVTINQENISSSLLHDVNFARNVARYVHITTQRHWSLTGKSG